MPTPRTQLGRALVTGLLLGLVGTAAVLSYLAWSGTRVPCEFPGTTQCTFDLGLAAEIARLQLFGAAGCLCVATGLALLLRRRNE